jgi:hypothetical protein
VAILFFNLNIPKMKNQLLVLALISFVFSCKKDNLEIIEDSSILTLNEARGYINLRFPETTVDLLSSNSTVKKQKTLQLVHR